MILKEALAQLETLPELADLLAKIPKSNQKTQAAHSEAAYHLALSLYLTDQLDRAQKVLALLAQVDFDGDYNHWTFVELNLILYAHIKRNEEDASEQLRQRLLSPLTAGNDVQQRVKARVRQRRLAGSRLDDLRAELASSQEDGQRQNFYRRLLLSELMRLYLFADETPFDKEELKQQIFDEEAQLKTSIAKHSIFQDYPFKTW